ncbi:MAG: ABC transporter ATP-binding protein [Rickettsiales bacterium]|nr:ABC transporter ATP-binding protein [Rickettsiales bacterium]
MSIILHLSHIRKGFVQGAETLQILSDLSLSIAAGEMVALVGPSGSGKTTLLQIAGLMARPDAGEVLIEGRACETLSESAQTLMRRDTIGFIYQFHHLLPELSALENVMMPALLAGNQKDIAAKNAAELLDRVGLSPRLSHRPAELSGGEKQRVAIARALANRPSLILADEPTGNLDPETSASVFALLRSVLHERAAAALIVTHNHELASACDRVLRLSKGSIIA